MRLTIYKRMVNDAALLALLLTTHLELARGRNPNNIISREQRTDLDHDHDITQRTNRKNVLFIVADDLRPQLPNYDCLQCSSMVTPNLRQFASLATTFTNAFSNQAMCGPSRTSFLTGRRPGGVDFRMYIYWLHSSTRSQVSVWPWLALQASMMY